MNIYAVKVRYSPKYARHIARAVHTTSERARDGEREGETAN